MRLFLLLIAMITNSSLFAEDLTIGTRPFIPPFEMMAGKNNSFTGFDIELMMDVCKRIGANCSFKPRPFIQLFNDVQTNKIDLAMSAITITNERKEYVLFSIPYFQSSGQFMAKSLSHLNSFNDIRGKRAGIELGTTGKGLIQARFGEDVTILEFATTQDVLQALADDNVDVILMDTGAAQYWVANNNQYQLVDIPISDGSGYGIMTNKTKTDLINRINTALTQIENDGTYLKLYSRYFSKFSP